MYISSEYYRLTQFFYKGKGEFMENDAYGLNTTDRFCECPDCCCPEYSLHQLAYLTARSQGGTVKPNETIVYGSAITTNGHHIAHTPGTSDFILAGGHTYRIDFSVNGINTTTTQGMIFAIKKNNFITDGRVISQNINVTVPYNSGWANYYLTVSPHSKVTISIVNLGLDTISIVNSNISIEQLTD